VGTATILDIEGLLSPISDASPCGSDPRLDSAPVSIYQTLKDARRAAADAERNIERGFAEESDAKSAEETARKSWDLIVTEGPPFIATVAKDLEISAWLTEALLRRQQLAGLRDGLLLTSQLVRLYWEGLYPLPDEDGLETRLIPITGLMGGENDGRLLLPLKKVRLTEGGDLPSFALWQYEGAAAGTAEGGVTIDAFTASLQRSSDEFVRCLIEDARACVSALDQLEANLKAHCADETPSFSRVRDVLSSILDAIKARAPVIVEVAPAVPDASGGEAASGAALPETAGEQRRDRVLDREGAFRQLEELARFFRTTEPHSPIAYAIENLVRRGRMSFSELVQELIDDGNVRRSYFVNAGIQPPPDGAAG
jgi:type VI secretion system protein ImpA